MGRHHAHAVKIGSGLRRKKRKRKAEGQALKLTKVIAWVCTDPLCSGHRPLPCGIEGPPLRTA